MGFAAGGTSYALFLRSSTVKRYDTDMDLAAIQHAIESLPPEEQGALFTWLSERDHAQWDAELERDFSQGGDGMELLERVKGRIRRGESQPMTESRPIR